MAPGDRSPGLGSAAGPTGEDGRVVRLGAGEELLQRRHLASGEEVRPVGLHRVSEVSLHSAELPLGTGQ